MSKRATPARERIFLALELPAEVRWKLGNLAHRLPNPPRTLKWVSPNLLHVTVRFLGATDPERLPALKEAALESAAGVHRFTLALSEVGAFPDERVPRVLWVGLRQDGGYADLRRLFNRLERALVVHGFEAEGRDYSPHITIARVRNDASMADRRSIGFSLPAIRSHPLESHAFSVAELVVMRSDLRPDGPLYTPLFRAPLGDAGAARESPA